MGRGRVMRITICIGTALHRLGREEQSHSPQYANNWSPSFFDLNAILGGGECNHTRHVTSHAVPRRF